MNLDGSDRLQDADDDFIVYPTQVVLAPHRKQAVRVQFIGEPEPDTELAYRIIAEQLPVHLKEEQKPGASVRILVRYVGSIYVRPKSAEHEVVLENASPQELEDGSTGLAITLRNRGTAHAILSNLKLSLSSENGAGPVGVTLSSELLKGMTGENILAAHSRQFVVPWPAKLPHGPVGVSFVFDKDPQ
jgi:fimbrial chaperone protein